MPRWIQLLLGLVCMIVISSPQYVWALFTQPLTTALGTSLAQLQVTFSILIVVQTFLSPFQGVLVDRFGPRLLLSIGTVVSGLSWVLAAQASSVAMLYLTYGLLGGVGTGIVYVGVIGHMVQWFPDRRGLATGLVAAGYGMGALLTTFPIASVLRESSYQAALVRFGIIFALVGPAAAAAGVVARPDHQRRDAAVLRVGVGSDRPREHDADRVRTRGRGGNHTQRSPRGRDTQRYQRVATRPQSWPALLHPAISAIGFVSHSCIKGTRARRQRQGDEQLRARRKPYAEIAKRQRHAEVPTRGHASAALACSAAPRRSLR